MLQTADEAGRLVNGEPVALPRAGGGEKLHGIVVLDRRLIRRLDPCSGTRPSRFDIADVSVLMLVLEVGKLLARAFKLEGAALDLEPHSDGLRCLRGTLAGLRHHQRHDLAGVGDLRGG